MCKLHLVVVYKAFFKRLLICQYIFSCIFMEWTYVMLIKELLRETIAILSSQNSTLHSVCFLVIIPFLILTHFFNLLSQAKQSVDKWCLTCNYEDTKYLEIHGTSHLSVYFLCCLLIVCCLLSNF